MSATHPTLLWSLVLVLLATTLLAVCAAAIVQTLTTLARSLARLWRAWRQWQQRRAEDHAADLSYRTLRQAFRQPLPPDDDDEPPDAA